MGVPHPDGRFRRFAAGVWCFGASDMVVAGALSRPLSAVRAMHHAGGLKAINPLPAT